MLTPCDSDPSVELDARKSYIEPHLFACLPGEKERPPALSAAMRHAVLCGGKRLRPILCLSAAEAAGGELKDAIAPACAIELLHTYTLVHDDLPCMDNDTLRRGAPTVWAKFGESTAVLVGDALQALAFEVLARTPEKRPGIAAALVRELGKAAGHAGVIAGQVEDIAYASGATRAQIAYVFQHKTADLFMAAVRLGAIAAAAAPETVKALTAYAQNLGIAFQITDDLQDAAQSKADDKPELSCLAAMTAADARAWAASCTDAALAALAQLPDGNASFLSSLAKLLLKR